MADRPVIAIIVIVSVNGISAAGVDRVAHGHVTAKACLAEFEHDIVIFIRCQRNATGNVDILLLRRATDNTVFLTFQTPSPYLNTDKVRNERPRHVIGTLQELPNLECCCTVPSTVKDPLHVSDTFW